ncbi:unnamed protein product [Amoebophrya sp. A120]|nr:unnamed protein product [Amoebophrya sp. A120]|eukprot:GSA120T00015684001.1
MRLGLLWHREARLRRSPGRWCRPGKHPGRFRVRAVEGDRGGGGGFTLTPEGETEGTDVSTADAEDGIHDILSQLLSEDGLCSQFVSVERSCMNGVSLLEQVSAFASFNQIRLPRRLPCRLRTGTFAGYPTRRPHTASSSPPPAQFPGYLAIIPSPRHMEDPTPRQRVASSAAPPIRNASGRIMKLMTAERRSPKPRKASAKPCGRSSRRPQMRGHR